MRFGGLGESGLECRRFGFRVRVQRGVRGLKI